MINLFFIRLSLIIFVLGIIFNVSCATDSDNLDIKYSRKVQTPESTVDSFYSSISSNDENGLDWDLLKYTMHPEGRIISYEPDQNGAHNLNIFNSEEYIKKYRNYMERAGFYEKELFKKVTSFGAISHVLSGYASYDNKSEKPLVRGINSFQLLNDGNRWWIINISFTRETPNNPIPEEFMKN